MSESRLIKRICPYCFLETTNAEAGFLLKGESYHFLSPALNEIVAAKVDVSYLNFWTSMGITEEHVDAKRTVIDNQDIAQLNQELMASGKEVAAKIYDEDSNGYSFHMQEGGVTVYSNTMVCHRCHNPLPQNFFKYDMLKIGLAGSIASGKTVYLCSLIMNGYEVLQRDNLTVRSAGNLWDKHSVEMEEMADRLWRYGICPDSTQKMFRKPVFMEMTYRLGAKNFHLLTAIYDVAGEVLRNASGSGRTRFLRHVDGFICLVDPAQMHLDHAVITNQIPDEERVLSKLYVMPREKQIAFQRMSNENGKQVMDFMDFMAAEGPSDSFLFERKAEVILDNIRRVLGDVGLKQKYMALTLAKSDLLEELGEIKAYPGSSLLFEKASVSYGFFDMDHHFLRQDILRQIFDQKVFRLQRSLDDYKESSMFAVSALGCETEITEGDNGYIEKTVGRVRPFRVEDPVLWMVMKYMRERRWFE